MTLQLRALKDVQEGSGPGTIHRVNNKTLEEKDMTAVPHEAEKPNVGDDADLMQDERGICEEAAPGSLEGVRGLEVVTTEILETPPLEIVDNESLGVHGLEVTTENLETPPLEIGDNESLGKRKYLPDMNTGGNESVHGSDDLQDSASKKQKTILVLDVASMSNEAIGSVDCPSSTSSPQLGIGAPNDNDAQIISKNNQKESAESTPDNFTLSGNTICDEANDNVRDGNKDIVEVPDLKQSSTDWKPIERELYLKGVEIFGRNRYGGSQLVSFSWNNL